MNDSTLITISWDTTTETNTVAALREKFAKTNLFDDGVWSTMSTWSTSLENLAQVLEHMQPGEEWTCDNCTVSLAEETQRDPLADPLIELIEEVQSESFQWNEDGTLNKYPDEQMEESLTHRIIVKTGDTFYICVPSDWLELDWREHYDTWSDTAQARKEIAELRDDNILWDLSPGCFAIDANTGIEDLFGTVNHLYTMVDEGFLTARAAMLAITGGAA